MRRAVVLLSGGLDSATVLAVASRDGFACHALSFDYGQRHAVELAAARAVASRLRAAEHVVLPLDLRPIAASSLTRDLPVPKDRDETVRDAGIPSTYVPARNMVFLSLAAGYAETIGARDVYLGVNAVDYSGYPDCRPDFLAAMERTINLATKAGVESTAEPWFRLRTPIIGLRKHEIIRLGHSLGVDYALTHSCYDPAFVGGGVRACGRCDSCRIRAKGFADAGVPDPTRYA